MALTQPIFQENDTADQHALDLRRLVVTLFGDRGGVVGLNDLKVSQRGAGADLSVDVASGTILIQGNSVSNQGLYHVVNDAVTNVLVPTPHATLARRDLLIVKVRDSFYAGAQNDAVFEVVQGDAGSASDPDPYALGHRSYWVLARIRVPAGATSITDTVIDDLRTGYAAQYTKATLMNTDAPGVVKMYGGTVAPAGYLLCHGQEISRATYKDLFDVVGTAGGAGNGTTTFNVFDYRGRMPIGVNAADAALDIVGESGGSKTHTLTVAEMPSHNHSHKHAIDGDTGNRIVVTVASSTFAIVSNTAADAVQAVSYTDIDVDATNTGDGAPHPIMPPYRAINFIIKY